jgi:hypothetical protein
MDEARDRVIPLEQLEGQTIAFLDLAEEIGRPLRRGERNAFRWLLESYEDPSIQGRLAALPTSQIDYYSGRIVQLAAVIAPAGSRR